MPTQTVDARFWAKVARGAAGDCWEWTAVVNRGGYGVFRDAHGRAVLAHRFAYAQYVAPLAPKSRGRSGARGQVVCHHCDNRRCVNPAHLFVGSQAENLADMDRKGRRQSRSKLTHAEAQEIRATELTYRGAGVELARRYGVSPQAICDIQKGRRWK